MQELSKVNTEEFDLRVAAMPRGYACHLAAKLNVPTKRIYKVRYGEQEDKRVYLELLVLAIEFQEEQAKLSEAIAKQKKRFSGKVAENQISLF